MAISPILPVYIPKDIKFVFGEGSTLYDEAGKSYVDFASGIAVNSLGYNNSELVRAIKDQGEKLWHVSNSYVVPQAIVLAKKIIANSFADTVFFTNSGAEANECGLKIVRSYQSSIGYPERCRFITLKGSFHGRTYAACSANDPSRFSKLLYPYVDWFDNVEPNIESISDAINENTGAILLEPIQGEGGIKVFDRKFLEDLRVLCDDRGVLLFFDCVQCGCGRTGKFFAYEYTNITPDICSLAKGIGGGFPLGACLATEKVARFMTLGMHGSTYGGNPLATTIGNVVIDQVLSPGFLENVINKSQYLIDKLKVLANKFSVIQEIRGKGLMLGIKVNVDNKTLSKELSDYGLLTIGTTSDSVVRILPPLVITKQEIDEGIARLTEYLSNKFS